MGKVLIVIDMQNDFVTGTLGNKEAQAIVPNVQAKVKEYADRGDRIILPGIPMRRIIWTRRRGKSYQ